MSSESGTPNPFFSIITVVKNAPEDLARTIQSVHRQTCRDLEFIIVDGKSDDNQTLPLIRENAETISRWISEPDTGIYNAMNKGLKLAHGRYLNFLNAGDILVEDNTLDKVREFILGTETQGIFYYGDRIMRDDSGKKIVQKPGGLEGEYLLGRAPFFHQSLFIERKAHQAEPYDERYFLSGDLELCLRLLEKHPDRAYYLEQPLIEFQAGGLSTRFLELSRVETLFVQSNYYRKKTGKFFPIRESFFFRNLVNFMKNRPNKGK